MKYYNNEQRPSDEADDAYLDALDEEKSGFLKPLVAVFIIVLAVGGAGLLGWVFYQGKTMPAEEVPLIKADKNPVKIKPQEPGGMVVANMDKTVYDNFADNADNVSQSEKVLPSPEEPVDRIQVITGQPKKPVAEEPEEDAEKPVNDEEMVESEADEGEVSAASGRQATLSEAVKESSGDGVRPLTESDLKIVLEDPAEKVQNAVKSAVVDGGEGGGAGYKVQLGAYKSEQDAVDSWRKIQAVHTDLLGSLQYSIERKEVEGKGMFYRLQVGMVPEESAARSLCKKLAEVKQECFVVE